VSVPADLYLALDQGGHASRALLFDGCGRVVAESFAPVATHRPAPDRVEHDAEELVGSMRQAVEAVAKRDSPAPGRIAAAGIATQRSSVVCWDRGSGTALTPVISWQDRRHAAWLKQFAEHSAWIRAQTGLPLSPHYGASKLRWCLDHVPAVQAALARGRLAIGPVASFLLFRLLDERPFAVDPANASRTQLWDPLLRDWSVPLCDLFGIGQSLLPQCVGTRHDFGTLRFGSRAVPLSIATGDQSAVPFAFGEVDAGTAYVNVGTGAFVQLPVRGELPAAPKMLASVLRADGAHVEYALEGTVNGAGAALDWFAAREARPLDELLGDLAGAAVGALDPPLFLNGISGLGSPFWVSDFESGFVGPGSGRERLLAVLESVAFLISVNLAELRRLAPALRRVLVTGGMSGNDVFCATLAAACGMPVARHSVAESTARGLAVLLGADVTGASAGEARVFAPDSTAGVAPGVAQRFQRWLSAMRGALDGTTGARGS
jgi:glycerol kinase